MTVSDLDESLDHHYVASQRIECTMLQVPEEQQITMEMFRIHSRSYCQEIYHPWLLVEAGIPCYQEGFHLREPERG